MRQPNSHIDFLDYLRGVAILSVFAFHSLKAGFDYDVLPWAGWLPTLAVCHSFYLAFPATFGWAGVAIFFAISGFCIHLSHERSKDKSFKVFFIRRFFRIYPPYVLAVMFLVFLFFPAANIFFPPAGYTLATLPRQIYQLVTHLCLVHNFSDAAISGINVSFWSIAIECQLYLIYPLLLALVSRVGWKNALWITAIIELSLRSLESIWIFTTPPHNLPRLLSSSPLSYWFSWTVGAALADAYLKGEALPFRGRIGFLFPLLFVAFSFFMPLIPYRFPLIALSTAYLISYFLANPPAGPEGQGWLEYPLKLVRWAGVVSYSAYLIHQPLVNQVPRVIGFIFRHPTLSPGFMYATCLSSWLPIFALSYLSYRYIELPFIDWGKQIIARSKPAQVKWVADEVIASE